jgi:hypothetical protein
MLHADAINLEELESQGRQLDALQDMEAPEGAFRWALHECYNMSHVLSLFLPCQDSLCPTVASQS